MRPKKVARKTYPCQHTSMTSMILDERLWSNKVGMIEDEPSILAGWDSVWREELCEASEERNGEGIFKNVN